MSHVFLLLTCGCGVFVLVLDLVFECLSLLLQFKLCLGVLSCLLQQLGCALVVYQFDALANSRGTQSSECVGKGHVTRKLMRTRTSRRAPKKQRYKYLNCVLPRAID